MRRLSIVLRAIIIPIAALILIRRLYQPFDANAASYFVAVVLIVFVLAVDLATLARGYLQNLLVGVAALCVGLVAVELATERMLPREVENKKDTMWAFDPNFGYHVDKLGVVQAEKSVDGHLAYKVAYTIDQDLRRLTRSSATGVRVRFFGDSYTFGEGLNDSETLPQLFANQTGANVLNFGFPGYGPSQALLALRLGLYDKDLDGSRLFVLQTAPFHVYRTACMPEFANNFPRFVTAGGEVELQGKCKPHPWQSTGIYQVLLEGLDQRVQRADVENYLNIVNAFTGLAQRKYHASVVILYMHADSEKELRYSGFTSKDLEASFRQAGAIVIDDTISATPGDTLKIPYDGHPTGLANRLLAEKMVGDLMKTNPKLF